MATDLRNRSLLRAVVLRACHVIARCWEPWCEELFALPIALLFNVSAPSERFFGGPTTRRQAVSGPFGTSWGLLETCGRLGTSDTHETTTDTHETYLFNTYGNQVIYLFIYLFIYLSLFANSHKHVAKMN